MDFVNKVIIVTGGVSGIGAATARVFAKEKANVVILDINLERISKITAECEKLSGLKPFTLKVDVGNDEEVKEAIDKIIKQHKRIDVLVNNAGVNIGHTIFSENLMEIYDRMTSVNFRAVIHLTHLAVPYLIESKGCIINIASVMGRGIGTEVIYSATKAGIEHFSKCVALELASKGVRVNSILPGPVYSDLFTNQGMTETRNREIFTKMGKLTPLGKSSEPEEIGELVAFLASDKAKSITGSSYVIDNGSLLRGVQRFVELCV